MPVEYLDIRINTQEGIPIQLRVPIDTTTRDTLMKLHVTSVTLMHTLSHLQMQGFGLKNEQPNVGGIDSLRIDGK